MSAAGQRQSPSSPEDVRVTDVPGRAESARSTAREPGELLIELVDEQTLREARERNAARVRLLWDRRKYLFKAAITGLIVGTAFAYLLPTRYTSTAGLMPPINGTGPNMMAAMLANRVGSGLANLAQGALGIQTTGALFVQILKSDTVRDDVIQKFDLRKVYGARFMADAREALGNHTGVSEDEKSGVITISVVDHDPKRAAGMAQEYVNELNWVVNNLSASSAHREREFLDERLAQVKTELEGAEQQFSQFASKKGAIDIPEQGKAMVTAAATLQGQLIAAESELQGFRQIYTDNNARVRSMQARVNELRGSLEKLAGTSASEQSSARELYPSLHELPLLGVNYADLLRRTKVEEAIFETLTQEDELAKVEEVREIPSVKVLDPPEVPEKKSFPPRVTIMVLTTMLSLVVGAAWVMTSTAWQKMEPTDPRKAVMTEVWSDMSASLPWNHRNGTTNGGAKG